MTDSSFDSTPEEAVAMDPEEYCGSTGFGEGGGVDGSVADGGDASWGGGVLPGDVSRRICSGGASRERTSLNCP